ncbi:MAG: hypothetical protein Ta2A_02100 [Treponemataceae bacterium]|nr:MAG: hypothetical protein Ta2A_02100 [Treponemataceae bacterium]
MSDKPFVPELGYACPDDTTEHILHIAGKNKLPELDENFPYVNKTLWHRIKRAALYCFIWTVVFLVQCIRFNLRIEGRQNIRKYRKALKNGAITVCNHVHKWDFLLILQALKYRRIWVPSWKNNFNGSDGALMDTIGAIPLPETYAGNKGFMRALDKLHAEKEWIQIYPEVALWPCFQPIRPFRRGAFVFAYRYDVPIVPLAISYREVKNPIYKFFKKNAPYITVRIGEPIFPDHNVSDRQGIDAMRTKCHASVCALAGIAPGENPYPAAID